VVLETQHTNQKIVAVTSDFASQADDAGGSIDAAIEKLTHWAEREFGSEELIAAREEFFAKFGKVFYDDSFFGSRMSYFINYYLFERSITKEGVKNISPVRYYLDLNPERTDAASIQVIHELSLCIHGIFQVLKVKNNQDAIFLNLLTQDKIPMRLPKNYRLFGLKKNQILQGFVFRTQTGYHPAAGIAYHPEGVFPILKKAIKAANKSADADHLEFLGRTASSQLKATRLKHVDPKTIYKTDLL
jgi:hypothetical protein